MRFLAVRARAPMTMGGCATPPPSLVREERTLSEQHTCGRVNDSPAIKHTLFQFHVAKGLVQLRNNYYRPACTIVQQSHIYRCLGTRESLGTGERSIMGVCGEDNTTDSYRFLNGEHLAQ